MTIEEVYEQKNACFSNEDFIVVSILQELWLKGDLKHEEGRYHIPCAVVYELDAFEKACLGLPMQYVDRIEIKSSGIVTSNQFKISSVYKTNHGPLRLPTRFGNVVKSMSGDYLLDQHQFEIAETIDQVNEATNKDFRMEALGKLSRYKGSDGLEFDRYLRETEYVTLDKIELDFEEADGTIVFKPKADVLDEQENSAFQSSDPNASTLSFADGIKRKRVLITSENRGIVKKIRSMPALEGDDVPNFYLNPAPYLPEELPLDINEFGERVRGFHKVIYQANPRISIKRNKGGWMDVEIKGNLVDPVTGDEINIEEDELRDVISQAVENDREYIQYGDDWIKTNKETNNPVLDKLDQHGIKNGSKISDSRIVLDIFENVEMLDYVEGDEEWQKNDDHGIEMIPVPQSVNATLMAHQHQGFSWLYQNVSIPRGSLLADDMGLGKTLQIITLLAAIKNEQSIKPTLIVLPKALMENWHSEIKKFLIRPLQVYYHAGLNRIKDPSFLENQEIVFTTYETLSRDQQYMGSVKWKLVILDEAQKIKNTTAVMTIAAKAMNTKKRIALTGTPVENNLLELWCIVDFIQPGFLGSMSEFRKIYQMPIEKDQDREMAVKLHEKLAPVLMRRNKRDILLDLPEKEEQFIDCTMSKDQLIMYMNIVKAVKRDQQMSVLSVIQKLIMLCSHPALVNDEGVLGPVEDYLKVDKLKKTIEIIETIHEKGEKVLIFTRYKKMQALLARVLTERFGIYPIIINGEVTSNRAGLVNAFNAAPGFNAMVLSPKAAGVGLNITGANHVIHYTREWNPAVENQATDRVYRIGQEKNVRVYYPIVRFPGQGISVEERQHELMSEKRQLFENTIIPTEKLTINAEEFESVFDAVTTG